MSALIRNNGIRENDIFARYGGEEFVILLPKTNIKQSFEIAERLRKLIETKEFIYDGKRLPVTASIGVADYRQGVLTGTDLFKRADEAVYKSKQGGRNLVNFYRE
jgi:diguanylate cyclase (GGDEF)-like protein